MCQGSYDTALIKAWEAWDENRPSENDHPEAFPENQVSLSILMFALSVLHVKFDHSN